MVSLLISKEKPTVAESTLSPTLREIAGIGTLGATKLKDSNITEARRQDDITVATGWRLMGINNMVDSVVLAAEKLENEIHRETKYWADVLAVSESGWNICALPHEPHTLGVRFGFAEAAPEFRNSSIAPLRRNDDGSIRLDLGRVGGGSQRIRITRKKNGVIVDQSPLPGRIPDDAPLQDRVLEARNTAYHQELWYEINREARTLLSSDVYSDASSITWKQDSETDIVFTLEDLAEPDNAKENISVVQLCCTTYYVYMQFLLFQGHRQNYHRRTTLTQLPPNRGTLQQPYAIIRAVVANTGYYRDCKIMTDFLEDLVLTLRRAGISTASCKSTYQPLVPILQQLSTRRNPKMELNFINHLVGRLESMYELNITPEARIFIRGRIAIVPFIGVLFGISLTPFSAYNASAAANPNNPNNNSGDGNANKPATEQVGGQTPFNPLEISYPPSDPGRDPYPNVSEATYYIKQATVHAVAQKLADEAAQQMGRDDIDCADTVRGFGITDRDGREAYIEITPDEVDQQMILRLCSYSQRRIDGNVRVHRWAWRADQDDKTGRNIKQVLRMILRGQS